MNATIFKLNDADRAVNYTEAIQGHVGPSVPQVFTEKRTRVLFNRRLNLECREHIVKDQFSNLYVVFTAKLLDGEMYAVTRWVAHPVNGLVKELRALGARRFDDALLGWLQDEAFLAFGRMTVAILKGRQAAALPMISALPSGHELPDTVTINQIHA